MNPRAKTVPTERPVVFQFLDARKFLAAAFEFEKAGNPVFSHRYVAKAMGASSSGFFKDILTGRIGISPARAAKFARLFKLSTTEAEHFESLALYTQAASADEKELYLGKLSGKAGAGGHAVLEAFQLEYFQKWHYAAVRELLALRSFRDDEDDHRRLAETLDPPLTVREAAEAVRLLLKLKLVTKNAQGVLARAEKVVCSGSKNPALVKPAIRGNLELALRALDAHPPAMRPFSYLTLSVSEASLPRIREKLATLRRELLEIAVEDDNVDRLYQMNFQMFPLSKTVKRGKS
jgi:uncharacterized protein (TIGR02147 family)